MIPASDGSAYSEYELTEKGKDLWPTLVALRQWGEKHMFGQAGDPSVLLDARDHRPLAEMVVRSADGRELGLEDVELVMPA